MNKHEQLYAKAHEAGMAAGNALNPLPMYVGTPTTLFGDDIDRTKPVYKVEGGVCGFAWIKVRPATSGFAKWLKATGKVRSVSYTGGYDIWVSGFGQSMAKKEAYADAFSEVLREAGIKAYSQSRMD